MATNYTTNYQLNQWEPTDQVLRTDFNADNTKIDAALAAKAEAAALNSLTQTVNQKASQSAVNTLNTTVQQIQANLTKLTFGTYTGNGTASRTISLGFTPKAVLVLSAFGGTYSEEYAGDLWGGLALANYPVRVRNGGNETAVNIVPNGFQVSAGLAANGTDRLSSNNSSLLYHYIAFS